MNKWVIIITQTMKACTDKHKIAHHQKNLNEMLKKMGSKLCSTA